ncbi:MAG: extracellular solute-binding protein [Candidatus Aureabacteria bacterium]|nr:extracellular solute-binding protein [Candidatus Auribacterota bacterium]
MFRKGNLFFLFVLFFCLCFIYAGCGKKRSDSDAVIIWHWMTDRHDTFLKLSKQYKAETGKTVIFELSAPTDVYTSKVRAAAQTNTLPDIFSVLGVSQDLSNFIHAGLIHCLTPYMEENHHEWERSFYPNAIGMNAFTEPNQWNVPEGIYGVPIDVTNIQMIYNKDIFKTAGIDKIPETWEEFLKAGDLVTSKTDKQFFVVGFGETWLINTMVRIFAYNLIGEKKLIQTIKGECPYSSAEWIDIFNKFREMSEKKLFAAGIVTMINRNAERLFATGRAAVTYNGSWSVNVFRGMNPDLNYGTMFFPKISDHYPLLIQGGAGSSLMVSEHSLRKKEAVAFLKWMTSKSSQIFLSTETNNLPSNKEAVGQMPAILNEYAKDMDKTFHPALLPVGEDPNIEEATARGIQSIIIGETTPEELAEKITLLKKQTLNESE